MKSNSSLFDTVLKSVFIFMILFTSILQHGISDACFGSSMTILLYLKHAYHAHISIPMSFIYSIVFILMTYQKPIIEKEVISTPKNEEKKGYYYS